MARGWPLWGAAVWLVAQVYLIDALNPWMAVAASTSLALGAGSIAVTLAGPQRTHVRTMTAAVMVGRPDLGSIAERDQIQRLGVRLIRADDSLADGGLTAAEHESIWWRTYDEIDSYRPATTRA